MRPTFNSTNLRMVGPWPPSKGVSLYCYHLATALGRLAPLEFTAFSELYPARLYPGRTTEMDTFEANVPKDARLRIAREISYREPASWMKPGLRPSGILHLHWWTPYLSFIYTPMMRLAKRRSTGLILTLHNVLPHESSEIDKLATHLVASQTSRFIVHSERNKTQAKDALGIGDERIRVIPHGPLTILTRWTVPREEARKTLRIPEGKKVLLFFGNLRGYKGFRTLLEATRIATKQVNNLLLLIAGEVWKGQESLLKMPQHLKKILRVYPRFVPTERTAIFFQAADLVVVPYTRFRGQSGVAAAAHAFGKPLIVTDVGGLPKMVRDRDAVARARDPRDLADRICRIIGDEDTLKKLAKDSSILASRFSWIDIARTTLRIYESLS
ncbi:MAG: glycosyltransferase [Candidatus Geothermarchaeales archaeon]